MIRFGSGIAERTLLRFRQQSGNQSLGEPGQKTPDDHEGACRAPRAFGVHRRPLPELGKQGALEQPRRHEEVQDARGTEADERPRPESPRLRQQNR